MNNKKGEKVLGSNNPRASLPLPLAREKITTRREQQQQSPPGPFRLPDQDKDEIIRRNPVEQETAVENGAVAAEEKKKKKKRISKAEKEERKAKREADTLQQLYKPKDSHVHVITPDLFRKLKGESSSTPKGRPQTQQQRLFSPVVGSPAIPIATSNDHEFPSLKDISSSSSSPWANKSFAKVISSPAPPPKQEQRPLLSTPSTLGASITPSTSSQAKANLQQTPGLLHIPPATPFTSSAGSSSTKKLSKSPLVVSLDALIVKKEKVKGAKALRKNERTSALIRENVKFTVGNALDSSSPGVIHRGKIRVRPKKPSKLKRCILKGRELKKNQPLLPFVFNKLKDDENSSSQLECIKEDQEGGGDVEKERVAISDVKVEKQEDETITESKCEVKEEVSVFKELLTKAEEEATKKEQVIPDRIVELVKLQMHTRKFRSYCDMFVTKEFHVGVVVPMLKELYRLQDRMYQTDPIKFKTKRRFVNGLKDTLSALKLNKVQMVILAPDIEANNQKGGLDERVSEIIALSKEKNVPYVFSGNRFILGKAIMQTKSPVSAIAIFNYQSVEELFRKVIEAAEKLRENYQKTLKEKVEKLHIGEKDNCHVSSVSSDAALPSTRER